MYSLHITIPPSHLSLTCTSFFFVLACSRGWCRSQGASAGVVRGACECLPRGYPQGTRPLSDEAHSAHSLAQGCDDGDDAVVALMLMMMVTVMAAMVRLLVLGCEYCGLAKMELSTFINSL